MDAGAGCEWWMQVVDAGGGCGWWVRVVDGRAGPVAPSSRFPLMQRRGDTQAVHIS